MKVLEQGRDQRGWTTEARCTGDGNGNGGCWARLLVEQPDLFKTFSSCRYDTETFVTFRCMGCGVETDLPKGKVPPAVVATLPTKAEWKKAARGMDALRQMKAAIDAESAKHHGEYEGGVGDGMQLALEALGASAPEERLASLRASLTEKARAR